MTDNISRMYELAGIKRIYSEFNNDKETVVERVFSHYKQLELIKWLLLYPMTDEISLYFHEPTQTYNFNMFFISEIRGCRDSRIECNNSFEKALAGLVCELWEDLTDEQKQELKRILE